jgi:NAD(P)-dependent dehydrogenase (short-subunit alcohol dehydrogenase family)
VAAERHTGVRLVSLAPGVIDTEMQADIRAASLAQFPLRERFDALKANGQLTSPQTCAEHLVAALAHPAFGEVVLTDLRHG